MTNNSHKALVIAYFQTIIQDISSIKARAWTFILVCIAIVGAIMNIGNVKDIGSLAKGLLVLGQIVASASTVFITFNSNNHLHHRRKILSEIYKRFPEIKQIRDCGEGIDVTRKDSGDRFFTWLGAIVPMLSIIVVVVYLYNIEMSDLSFQVSS